MQKTAEDIMTTGVVTTTSCAIITEAAQVLARIYAALVSGADTGAVLRPPERSE